MYLFIEKQVTLTMIIEKTEVYYLNILVLFQINQIGLCFYFIIISTTNVGVHLFQWM